MAKRAQASQPVYRVWRADDEEENGREYGALTVEDAARLYADFCHRHRDGWEWTWPVTFHVRLDSSKELFAVSVNRDTVPEFYADKPLSFEGLENARHVIYGGQACCEDPRLDQPIWPVGQTKIDIREIVAYVLEEGRRNELNAITCAKCKKRAEQLVPQFVEARERAEQRKVEEARQAEIARTAPAQPAKKPIKDTIREMCSFIEAMINDLAQHESDPSMMDGHRAKLAEWKKVLR